MFDGVFFLYVFFWLIGVMIVCVIVGSLGVLFLMGCLGYCKD